MAMDATSPRIPAGQFKNRCLALLDEVARTGQRLVVTKRGNPVAVVVPFEEPPPIEGSVLRCDDLLSPAIDPKDWGMDER